MMRAAAAGGKGRPPNSPGRPGGRRDGLVPVRVDGGVHGANVFGAGFFAALRAFLDR